MGKGVVPDKKEEAENVKLKPISAKEVRQLSTFMLFFYCFFVTVGFALTMNFE